MPSLFDPATKVLGGKAQALLEMQLAGFPVPEFLCSPSDLVKAMETLGTPLAVRSSACAEDGRDVSFAGQFKSFLNLHTLEEVETAVRQCHESATAPSVVEYCRRNGIDPDALQMGVIVQRMVRPELAGVAFTVNPVTGAEEVVIEACAGLSNELMAGQAPALDPKHPLLQKYAPKIEHLARRIQRHFGAPQDIEFAIEDGNLFVLQSRPITRIGFAPGLGEWTNADFRDGGVSCGVCTPLMWSLYDFIWEDTLKGFLREIKLFDREFQAGRMFFGRPYWNLGEVKRCLAKLPGFVEREFDADLGVAVNYEGDGIGTPVTPWRIVKALPTVFAIESLWKKQERFDRDFLAARFGALIQKYETITADVETSLRSLIHEAYWITESNYFRTIYCASLAKLDFMNSFPDADYAALVAGLPELNHLAPTRALREMAARGETDATPLLHRFRHHSRRELDIRAPRWDEDPAWVEALLREYSRGTGAAHGVPASADGVGENSPPHELKSAPPVGTRTSCASPARAAASSRLPWRQRRSFARKLDRLRTFLWLREEMRDVSSRVYYLIRRHVLEIARRRGLGDDIFFMSFQDILADDRSHIARRREIYENYRHFRAPNEISSRLAFRGERAQGALRGIGASKGRVRRVAQVARTVEEALQAERGSILVCPFTDPGWTPVLDRVAGVVTETGGLLSHAAVICREYGIPAVLGVPGATERIPAGRTLLVDGDEGYVELLD